MLTMYWQYYALVSLRTVSGCALSSICSIPDAFAQLPPFSLDLGSFESLGNSTSGSPSGPCYKAGADEYCAYTDVYFNREGVSVVTTADSITHIAKRTAFQNGASVPRIDACYVEVELPGKGRGLVATEAIAAGRTLISRTPALVVNTNAVKGLGRDELDDLLAHAVDGLPSTHRDEVLGLSTHDRAKTHQEKVGKIFRTNSFSTGFHDGKSNFQSLFTEVSRINHGCRPNCAYFFDSDTFSQNVVAARAIAPGEELLVAYIDPILPRSERQRRLGAWGFECSCERCRAGTTGTAEAQRSDDNVAEIQRLWRALDDYSASSRATPAMAERLISLYGQEGLQSRMQEAYYRAAVEWIGVGEAGEASKYARLCVKYGTLFKGPGRPFIEKMEQLVASPTSHPQWRFRLRHADGY